jgi:transposase-like protein
MSVQRKRYSAEEKTKVAVEAIKGQKIINELAAEYGVHPTQITQWKKQALEEIRTGFSGGRERRERTDEALVASFYQEIGQLKMEMDWLKKVHRECGGKKGADPASTPSDQHCTTVRVAWLGTL